MKEGIFPTPRSSQNQMIQALRDGPKYMEELPKNQFTAYARQFTAEIRPEWDGRRLFCLYGDERRAIRRFIEDYENQIYERFGSKPTDLVSMMGDGMYPILCEEWVYGKHPIDRDEWNIILDERDPETLDVFKTSIEYVGYLTDHGTLGDKPESPDEEITLADLVPPGAEGEECKFQIAIDAEVETHDEDQG